MADSDEEYERKKARDKFKQERRDYERPRPEERPGQQGGYQQQFRKPYPSKPEYYNREKYSPQASYDGQPPYKRVRRDEGGDASEHRRYGAGGRYDYTTDGKGNQSGSNSLKSFKQFLLEQDDGISEQDALTKYKEYKESFVRRQLSDFFNSHKNEEWFKEKYHPDFFEENIKNAHVNIERRLEAFWTLENLKFFDNKVIHVDNANELIRFLDSLVILLEGGAPDDFEVLDLEVDNRSAVSDIEKPLVEKQDTEKPEKKQGGKKKRKYSGSDDSSSDSDSSSSSSSSGSDSDSGDESGEESDAEESKKKKKRSKKDNDAKIKKGSGDDAEEVVDTKAVESSDVEVKEEKIDDVKPVEEIAITEDAPTPVEAEPLESTEKVNGDLEDGEHAVPKRPRPLHRTHSIFLRNLHPSITRQEVEALCKAYPGYLRLALQDPAPERKFFRRGWVTFAHDVNIKEICWNLNNIRLKDCDLGAIVNRELSQRVRPVMTIANHKSVMRQDIKFAAKLIQLLDSKHGLYVDATSKQEVADDGSVAYSVASKNPLLKNISEYLVEEGSYEEEALLGGNSSGAIGDSSVQEVKIEIDGKLQSVLDKLIFYLRSVHSVDYYSATEYPNEDDMPHRCGIMHARGAVTMPDKPITQRELENYMKEFEGKITHLTQYANRIADADAKKLGLKSEESAVEAFVQENTKEVAQDKWLCPLSGKKFKGPEFIRKHIFNKHADRVDAVKKEVQFFNNYLKDPKRPHLAEVRTSQSRGEASGGQRRRADDYYEKGSGDHGHRSYSSEHRRQDYPYPPYPHYPYPYPPPDRYSAYRGYPDYRSPPSRAYYDRPSSYYDSRGGYNSKHGGYEYQQRPHRGYGDGGPRTVKIPLPGSRRVLNYTDLDAPEDY